MANPYQHLSIDERRDRFFGSIRKLEAYYEGAWGIFDQELPAAIRPEGARLIRQLTSPDPRRRGPIHRWKVEHTWDLNWGLRRIDIMRKILVNESLRRQRIYRRRAGG
jgi:hypothetical protein